MFLASWIALAKDPLGKIPDMIVVVFQAAEEHAAGTDTRNLRLLTLAAWTAPLGPRRSPAAVQIQFRRPESLQQCSRLGAPSPVAHVRDFGELIISEGLYIWNPDDSLDS
ncbi:MAG: hypothetical protein J0H60_25995, partial [Rhizobiales bacterium]|nr:hypothetical protein [Hyphomicrobiales bacterium]